MDARQLVAAPQEVTHMIVTLQEAKDALRVTSTAEDALIQNKLNEVLAVLLQFLEYGELDDFLYAETGSTEAELYAEHGEDWPTNGDLMAVQILRAAIFAAMAVVYDDRTASPLADGVKSILRRYRNPVMN
jgi:hypothetical protein